MSSIPTQDNTLKSHFLNLPDTAGLQAKERVGSIDEGALWEDFKRGSEVALSQIYSLYSKDIYNYGCQFTKNHELVRDSIQDLFIELIKSRASLGSTTSVKFYLYKSLRRKLVRALKKQSRLFVTDDIQEQGSFAVSISPELVLLKNQLDEDQRVLLEKSINALTVSQREAVLLYFYEGLSYAEISDLMEIGKVKSARALLYRAISAMTEFLTPYKSDLLPLLLFYLGLFKG
ncbi:MAG: sigma-70 family RNA polymerase sigma factor [Imperialibacter sp.]|uniref:RNA polymerase sigma factor n=1 Tax=Imperialibacter sp. TaxID=2038411 RepID=UPI0032EFE4A3